MESPALEGQKVGDPVKVEGSRKKAGGEVEAMEGAAGDAGAHAAVGSSHFPQRRREAGQPAIAFGWRSASALRFRHSSWRASAAEGPRPSGILAGLNYQRLGFPYMQPLRIDEDHRLVVSPKFGSERIMNPVERGTPLPKNVSLYHPIFRSFVELEGGEKFLASDWIKERTANVGTGYGKLFLQERDSVQIYPDQECSDWIPSDNWKNSAIQNRLPGYVHERIRRDFENAIGLAIASVL